MVTGAVVDTESVCGNSDFAEESKSFYKYNLLDFSLLVFFIFTIFATKV